MMLVLLLPLTGAWRQQLRLLHCGGGLLCFPSGLVRGLTFHLSTAQSGYAHRHASVCKAGLPAAGSRQGCSTHCHRPSPDCHI